MAAPGPRLLRTARSAGGGGAAAELPPLPALSQRLGVKGPRGRPLTAQMSIPPPTKKEARVHHFGVFIYPCRSSIWGSRCLEIPDPPDQDENQTSRTSVAFLSGVPLKRTKCATLNKKTLPMEIPTERGTPPKQKAKNNRGDRNGVHTAWVKIGGTRSVPFKQPEAGYPQKPCRNEWI